MSKNKMPRGGFGGGRGLGLPGAGGGGNMNNLLSQMQKLQKEMENRRQQKAQQSNQQQPQNSAEQDALVEKIAELKMLQRLQVRVNNRTRELEKLTSGDSPPDPALREQLRKLADVISRHAGSFCTQVADLDYHAHQDQ